MLTQERLKQMFTYDAETGIFTRVAFYDSYGNFTPMNKVFDKANHHSGYIYIRIDGSKYAVHRLAFLYETGSLPEFSVDHINGDRGDNSFKNLRCVTTAENNKNRALQSNNTTGVVGVTFHKGMFEARISVKGKRIHIGTYKTLEEAAQARKLKEVEFDFSAHHCRVNQDTLDAAKARPALTQERLKTLFTYDKEVGHLVRYAMYDSFGDYKKIPAKTYSNSNHRSGVINIKVDGVMYVAHRLVMLFVDGVMPHKDSEVRHKNGDKTDNRYENLLVVDKVSALRERGLQSNSTTGVKGVRLRGKRYQAVIGINGVQEYLGLFDTLEEAATARKNKEVELGFI